MIKKWLLLLFCGALCAAPLSGCQQRADGGAPASTAPPAAARTSSPAVSRPESAPEDSFAFTAVFEGGARDGETYVPGSALELSEVPTVLRVRLSSARTINCLRLEPDGFSGAPLGQTAVRLEAGGALVYDTARGLQSPSVLELSDAYVCRFDDTAAQEILLTLYAPAGQARLTGFSFDRLTGGTPVQAYLPVSTAPEAMEAYEGSLRRLDRVTVISGLCWDESGGVQVLSDNYAPLVKDLTARREGNSFALYATVYPRVDLGRAGTAGLTLDTVEKRSALARSLVAHAREYGLDGIDLDWETVQSSDWEHYADFILTLNELLEKDGKGLSAAFYPDDALLLRTDAAAAVSLNLMAYDQFDAQGRHATFSSAAQAARRAADHGYRQIFLGIPAYGRPLDGGASWPLYRDQSATQSVNLYGVAYFNGPLMARDKAALAQLSHLGGVFLYHLTGDLPAEDPFSLLGNID